METKTTPWSSLSTSFLGTYYKSTVAIDNKDILVTIQKYLGTRTDVILTYFKQLSDIPRGSFNLDGVRAFVSNWAKQHGFVYRRDDYGNIVVVVGQENDKSTNVIIQSHQDIVCEKTHDSNHDFAKDPIRLVVDGDKLIADGTTLGADNGLSLVASMYLAEQLKANAKDWFKNNTLYLLMTADEEIGLGGANNLGAYPFLPKTGFLLNADSEVAGEVCGGSTGASDSHIYLEVGDSHVAGGHFWRLELKSFKGGHSGIDINKGSASAIKTMALILHAIREHNHVDLVSLNGGKAHNAIPIACVAEFNVAIDPKSIIEKVMANVKETYGEDKAEYVLTEIKSEDSGKCFSESDRVIDLLMSIHQGILHMNPFTTGCVFTSNNLGVVTTKDGKLDINCLTRSDSETHMRNFYESLKILAKKFGGTISDFACYNGWAPVWSKSKTLAALKDSYKALYGKEPRVYSVHAGTECSEICKRYPLWDAQSIGPQINDAHTPAENLIISSIDPFYEWMYATVLRLGNM